MCILIIKRVAGNISIVTCDTTFNDMLRPLVITLLLAVSIYSSQNISSINPQN
jgi:hypothetical protein